MVLQDFSVYMCGANFSGQLGLPNVGEVFELTRLAIRANFVACGAVHTLFVTPEGDLYSTGGNSCGQLGLGDYEDRSVPVKVPHLKEVSIARCGEEFSVVITNASKVFTFGNFKSGLGNVGQLGTGQDQSSVPVEIKSIPSNLGAEHVACTKGSVLVVTRFCQTYIWGLVPDFSFDSNSAPVLPHQLQVLKLKKVKEIQCMRESFVIMTEYVLDSSYLVGLPLKPVEAGKKHIAKVNLIDSRCMFVLEPLDVVSVVCFDENGQKSRGDVACFWDNSNHTIELKVEKAGYHYLYVFVNGTALKHSPFIYTVSPASFHHASASVPSDQALVYAGNDLNLLVKVFDKFGNLLTSQDNRMTFQSTTGQCEIIDFEQGCFRVKVCLTEVGKFQFDLQVNGTKVEFSSDELNEAKPKTFPVIQLQVLPGVTFKETCSVEGLAEEYEVGQVVSFKIISRDRFRNTTWHRTKPWEISLPFSYDLEESLDSCSSMVSFLNQKSGKFGLTVAYEGFSFHSSSIVFRAGPVHFPHTRLSGDGCQNFNFTKTTSKTFTVEFFDSFFNPVAVQAATLAFSSTAPDFSLKNLNDFQLQGTYSVLTPGKHEFVFNTLAASQNSAFFFTVSSQKDPGLVLQEQREAELERKRLELQELETRRQAQEEQSRVEQEMRRRAELRKKQREIEEQEARAKLQEEAELKRREKLLKKIKMQETTKLRAFEALQKLEEEKNTKSLQRKQWKRTGGGFVVPFIVED